MISKIDPSDPVTSMHRITVYKFGTGKRDRHGLKPYQDSEYWIQHKSDTSIV